MFSRSGIHAFAKQASYVRLGRHALVRHFSRRVPQMRLSRIGKAVPVSLCFVVSSLVFYMRDHSALDLESLGNGVTVEELQKHTTVDKGIWVAINGKVYDLTTFISVHPGGLKIIVKYAGKNASAIFNKFHGPDFFAKYLSPKDCLGPLVGDLEEADDITEGKDDRQRQVYIDNLPPLSEVFTLTDFEYIASKICSPSAWYYYSLGAQDEITLRENHNAFSRIFFKPRVLVDVPEVDLSTVMLGAPTGVPFYVSAAAQAKLGHPDGELSISRGCSKENVIQMISHYSSYSAESILKQATQGQSHWYQLYVTSKQAAKSAVEQVEELGVRGLFVTVDTPELGRREKDMKLRARLERKVIEEPQEDEQKSKIKGIAENKGGVSEQDDGDNADDGHEDLKSNVVYGRDMMVTWKDIQEIRLWSSLPLAIKGVQSVEDIVLAAENGVDAVVLSNHGGRQLDYSRAPIEVLADAMPVLREKGLQNKIEIYIDGGVRRGGDVIKCLALGATGVGLGRVFLYANACYGEAGVKKAIELLKEEMRIDMRLLGVSKVSELGPQHLDLRNLHARSHPLDALYYGNYEPLSPPRFDHEN